MSTCPSVSVSGCADLQGIMKNKLLIVKSILILTVLLVQHPNVLAQPHSQIDQAQARIEATSSQIESAKIQAGTQGVNQTQQLAEQLRQSASSVAQDMSSMISSTRAAAETPNTNDSAATAKSYNMNQSPKTGIDATPPPPAAKWGIGGLKLSLCPSAVPSYQLPLNTD